MLIGYSKKLKFKERTQKCDIGAVRELIESVSVVSEDHQTDNHRGGGFPKKLVPAKFLVARDTMDSQLQLCNRNAPMFGLWEV